MDQKSLFFICPRVSARFLHCFCTVSRDAMGTLTCKIRQRVQKLPGWKSRCFAQKQRKLETSKIRVFCPVGSFNQRARDSSSLERTKIQRRIVRFLVGFSFYSQAARSLHGFCTPAGKPCFSLHCLHSVHRGGTCRASPRQAQWNLWQRVSRFTRCVKMVLQILLW